MKNFLPSALLFALVAIGTTASAQSIAISSPITGSTFEQNSVLPIRWSSSGFTGNVHIDISDDDGATWSQSSNYGGAINNGSYDYRLYNSGGKSYQMREAGSESYNAYGMLPSARTRVRVRAVNSNVIYATSGAFTVKPPFIQLLSPNGGEWVRPGEIFSVKWLTTGYNGGVNLAISTDSGASWEDVDYSFFANTGEKQFRISPDPNYPGALRLYDAGSSQYYVYKMPFGSRYRFRVRAGSSTNVAAFAVSAADFTISTNAPVNPTAGAALKPIAISTLTLCPAGGSVTAGFVLDGTGSQQVLIRAIGPGLTPLGVGGVLANPKLTVNKGSSVIKTNDDWSAVASEATALSAAFAATGAFGIASGSKDSAALLTLDAGSFTAQAASVDAAASGLIILEVYVLKN